MCAYIYIYIYICISAHTWQPSLRRHAYVRHCARPSPRDERVGAGAQQTFRSMCASLERTNGIANCSGCHILGFVSGCQAHVNPCCFPHCLGFPVALLVVRGWFGYPFGLASMMFIIICDPHWVCQLIPHAQLTTGKTNRCHPRKLTRRRAANLPCVFVGLRQHHQHSASCFKLSVYEIQPGLDINSIFV